VDGNRQSFLGAKPDGVRQLARVLDARDVDRADTDAVVRDTDADVAAGQAVPLEEMLEGVGKRVDVANLAADHDARGQRLPRDLDEARRPIDLDARGGELRRPDLQSNHLPGQN
jgi:hypothetical protein